MKKQQGHLITLIEFKAIKPLLNISDDRIQVAELVLFHGFTMEEAGKHFNWSKQHVSKTVKKIMSVLIAYKQAKEIEKTLLIKQ